jgi:heme-degrading monooxygenase HmoA
MIRHTVVFKLIHPKDSAGEKMFLGAIKKLSAIPGVQKFELLKQTSSKNNYDFGLSMEFETAKAYEGYNQHPDHIAFVQTFWTNEVRDFLEIDYEPLKL